ncbi:hypothetical protein [Aneurinibacillus migulanus]|uniref:Adhesin domain-containing protein n=2 Tax=Aneurinibacillus migulanus TaxID=47500 RepID=A0A1G8X2C7_ANEMI|nr:hypothetical protein [Aneurinibacillus migulanus]MED0896446.1 hypothetical protein [Aneurinibacillus migulanus]MED1618198.1 hypothetical protein [Aneurinibacillus migulanus]SDJ84486.1 hypothetical protein SAMN04487909_1309 [Aneurinibacillus migulanus]
MKRMKIMHGTIILALLLLITACGAKEESEKKLELPANDLSKLVIDHQNGTIQITGSADSGKIEVVALTKAKGISMEKLKLKLEARKENAYLDAQFGGQLFAMGSGAVDLEIKIPKQLQVDITSHRDGSIDISDLSSSAKIDNINGDIQVSNLSGSLEINNRDGNITIHDIGSDVTINNINGHINIDHVDGSAEIHVEDGNLDINHVMKNAIIAQSGNGKIKIGEVKGKIFQNK